MATKFEFKYISGVSLKYLTEVLERESEYFDVDIEIIKMEKNSNQFDMNDRTRYNVLYKGKY